MRGIPLAAVFVLASAAAFAQPPAAPPTPADQKAAKQPAADLPVSLDRIRRGLAALSAQPLVLPGRKDLPRFYVEVLGKPSFETFLQDFNLVNGPVPYAGMTHNEFLSMVTPKELYSSAGFGAAEVLQAALMFKGLEWVARKSVTGVVNARRERTLNAIRAEIKGDLAALAQARAAQAASAESDLAALTWLAGCWRGEAGGRIVEEQWMAPRGGTLLGTSRTVAGDQTVEYEFMQIRRQDDGVYFVAKPSGQAEGSFRLVTTAPALASEAAFENPAHDFPQRVIYRLQPDGSLLARIEGTQGGAARAIDFPMTSTPCR